MHFTAATYNIHRCVGRDGVHSPDRVRTVLGEFDADIIALQEFDNRARHRWPHIAPEDFSSPLGMNCITQETITDPDGGYQGNVLLTRHSVVDVRHIDLGRSGAETRRAIVSLVDMPEGPLVVVATHLGLSVAGRRRQAGVLVEAVEAFAGDHPVIMLGDFNEWLPVGGCHAIFTRRFDGGARPRTFPVWAPLLPLDRIWVGGGLELNASRVHRSAAADAASDHLPLVASVSASSNTRAANSTNRPGSDETSTINP